jgi:CRISPR-associated protein Cas1
MLKRTLYFGNPAWLSTKQQQLLIDLPDKDEKISVPIEDIGILVIDHREITLSQSLLCRLLENNVAVVSCNSQHMPQGMFLNFEGNQLQNLHWRRQISYSEERKNALWQQLISAKLANQAELLRQVSQNEAPLLRWAKRVEPGDSGGLEARGAAYYWPKVFSRWLPKTFNRGRSGEPPNNLLNYGYAILRAITARSIVGSGMLPAWGLHHHNKYNAYCLADDVMEPYRPFVDLLVVRVISNNGLSQELSPIIKRELLQLPTLDVSLELETRPLMVAMQHTTASLAQCFAGNRKKLKLPDMPEYERAF